MKTQFSTETDGSLVVRGQVVYSPTREFTREDIQLLVRTVGSHADLLAALKTLLWALDEAGVECIGKSAGRLAIARAEGRT